MTFFFTVNCVYANPTIIKVNDSDIYSQIEDLVLRSGYSREYASCLEFFIKINHKKENLDDYVNKGDIKKLQQDNSFGDYVCSNGGILSMVLWSIAFCLFILCISRCIYVCCCCCFHPSTKHVVVTHYPRQVQRV
jgi:hypothetical protein